MVCSTRAGPKENQGLKMNNSMAALLLVTVPPVCCWTKVAPGLRLFEGRPPYNGFCFFAERQANETKQVNLCKMFTRTLVNVPSTYMIFLTHLTDFESASSCCLYSGLLKRTSWPILSKICIHLLELLFSMQPAPRETSQWLCYCEAKWCFYSV